MQPKSIFFAYMQPILDFFPDSLNETNYFFKSNSVVFPPQSLAKFDRWELSDEDLVYLSRKALIKLLNILQILIITIIC